MEVGEVARELNWVEIKLIELCVYGERGRERERRGWKREREERERCVAKIRHHSQ